MKLWLGRHKLDPYLPASITEIVCYFVINFTTQVASGVYTSEMLVIWVRYSTNSFLNATENIDKICSISNSA
jgi:hypothetical protein